MIRALFAAVLMTIAGCAFGDTYQLTVSWTDPTVYNADDSPTYDMKYTVNAGPETVVTGLLAPSTTQTITATPGDPIDVAVRAENLGLYSAWSPWVTATASFPATQPDAQTNVTITVIRTGP